MNPFQMFIRGYITESEMDNFIDIWHKNGGSDKTPLHVFLGMSELVYEIYATDQNRWDSHLKYLRERHGICVR